MAAHAKLMPYYKKDISGMHNFLSELRQIVGTEHVLTDTDAMHPYLQDYRGRFVGTGLAVVRPSSTEQVAAIVTLCAAHKIAIVPQGGNTGLVGGSIPYHTNQIVINLSRMNNIREIDAANFTMTVEAGCVLSTIQQAAQDNNRYFPLSLASEGSCQIGGNIASNAGGILTIRYGNTRDLVLGIEAVLPDGTIWNGLRSLRKDNSGYDLKHLFIGSEGTLGIITAAVLKLYPDPGQRETFFAAMHSLDDVITLLGRMRAKFGDGLQAFELIARRGVEFALQYNTQCSDPVATQSDWYVLAEIAGGAHDDNTLRIALENALGQAFEDNLITDATIAQNEGQRTMFWTLRESVSDAQRYVGGSIKHDISVPVSKIPAFIREASTLVHELIDGVRPVIFGHVGDGNLHFNLTQPEQSDKEEFLARWDDINHHVHNIVQHYGGSIAAEHGVGTFKRDEMAMRKSPVEMALMRHIKNAIDPHNLMNPDKVLNT